MKREQSDEDKDDLKKATGKGVEEKIREREYVIVLVTENKCETFFLFIIIVLLIVFHFAIKK